MKIDELSRGESEVDIALIGGGPVGALLAYILGRGETSILMFTKDVPTCAPRMVAEEDP